MNLLPSASALRHSFSRLLSPRTARSPLSSSGIARLHTASALKMKVECQCGSVAFDTPQPAPLAVYHCHCTECQKQSSSAFGTSAIFPADAVFPLPGALRARLNVWTRPAKEGRTVDCYFCRECGVRVLHRIREADGAERPTVSVKGGLVEGLDWSTAKHIFTRSAVVPIPDGAERWEGTPEVMEGRKAEK